jgi:serine/threonine protein kinase
MNNANLKLGTELSGRYRVQKLLAHGGMASVYEALDLKLHRQVAVKVLAEHLSADQTFVDKFLTEARVAAALNHPNLVNIYDQGQHENSTYLVLELVTGTTLRHVLDDFKVIDTNRAVELMEAVLSGLQAAHNAGVIHRDVKPENILLSNEGRIKLSDFGLARNVDTRTEAQELLGTVGYMAPELLTGGVATKATDVYACGIMLFEMLTGTRPFVGEQNVQIAFQHANSRVPAPSTINSGVPAGLDQVVLSATEPNLQNRPQDAAALLSLITNFDNLDTGNRTTVIDPISLGAGATEVIKPIEQTESLEPFENIKSKRKLVPFLSWSLVAILLGSLGGWWFGAGPGAMSAVPDLSNRTFAQAEEALEPLQVEISSVRESSASIAAGLITRTDPAAGGLVGRGGKLVVYISSGPKLLPVPSLKNLDVAGATAKVVTAGFVLGSVDSQFSSTAIGLVIDHTGSDGLEIPEGSPIDLKISLGAIPAVSGLTLGAATDALKLVGLDVGKTTLAYSDSVPKGNVIDLAPNQLNLSKGSKVDLTVSKGTSKVTVPVVVGQRILAAQEILTNLGLKVLVDTNLPNSQWGLKNVKSSNPAAGTILRVGDTVTLVARY